MHEIQQTPRQIPVFLPLYPYGLRYQSAPSVPTPSIPEFLLEQRILEIFIRAELESDRYAARIAFGFIDLEMRDGDVG
jgi:hypothetical protein